MNLSPVNAHGMPLRVAPTPFFCAVLIRNKHLRFIDEMLRGGGTATGTSNVAQNPARATSTAAEIIPNSLWPRVLAKVGGGRGSNSSSQGGSPVYKILQARLASWPKANVRNSNKGMIRKRQYL